MGSFFSFSADNLALNGPLFTIFDDPLTATLVTSTGTWQRWYCFFEVCQAEGRRFESNLDQKFFVQVFFGFVVLFFANFLNVSKGSHLHFFLFCKRMVVQKLPKAPLLNFSALCDLPETKKIQIISGIFFNFFPHAGTLEENTWHFEVLLLFLSLWYGADLGRSRLVPYFRWKFFNNRKSFNTNDAGGVWWNAKFITDLLNAILTSQVKILASNSRCFERSRSCQDLIKKFKR